MQQILIGPSGELKVIEIGPRGIPGPPGPKGDPGPSTPGGAGRSGVEIVVPTTETIDAVEYKVVAVGATNAANYAVNIEGTQNILIRATATADASIAQFYHIRFSISSPDCKFFFDFGGPNPFPLWKGSTTGGDVAAEMVCIHGSMIGLDHDVWFPVPITNYSIPRVGSVFVAPSVEGGDGITDPDCLIALDSIGANAASATASVTGYTFPEITVLDTNGDRPLRLELLNASAVTKFKISNESGGTTTLDPDALNLRSGSSIVCTIHQIKTGPDDSNISYIADSILPGLSPVVPTVASRTIDTGASSAEDSEIGYDAARVIFTGTAVDLVGAWTFKNPGAGKVAKFRVVCTHATVNDPTLPGYVEASSDAVHPTGAYEITVVGQDTADAGDPISVMIIQILATEEV